MLEIVGWADLSQVAFLHNLQSISDFGVIYQGLEEAELPHRNDDMLEPST